MQFAVPEKLNLQIRDGDALQPLDSSKIGMVCFWQRYFKKGDGRHPVSNATISAHQCIPNQMRHRPGSRPLFLASWQRLSGRQTCTLFLVSFRGKRDHTLHPLWPALGTGPTSCCVRFVSSCVRPTQQVSRVTLCPTPLKGILTNRRYQWGPEHK